MYAWTSEKLSETKVKITRTRDFVRAHGDMNKNGSKRHYQKQAVTHQACAELLVVWRTVTRLLQKSGKGPVTIRLSVITRTLVLDVVALRRLGPRSAGRRAAPERQ
jgi:hypothetical protein